MPYDEYFLDAIWTGRRASDVPRSARFREIASRLIPLVVRLTFYSPIHLKLHMFHLVPCSVQFHLDLFSDWL